MLKLGGPELRVSRLCAWYGRTQALFDVEFVVPAGAVVALVGANGAGKTTIIRAILGLGRSSGSVVIDGKEVSAQRTFRRVRDFGIATVHEGRGLYYELTVLENLVIGFRRPENWEVARICEKFPSLAMRLATPVGRLSGGEQQMVAIGRVLLGAPRVVLLDEPGLGLSPRLVGDMYKYLEEIRQMGATTILVEQSIERAAAFASQMIVLSAGRVVEVLPSLSGESVARVERLLMGPGLDE